MKSKIILYIFIPFLLGLASCGREDSDVFIPNGNTTGADTNWLPTITANSPVLALQQELSLQAKTDSFEMSAGATIQFPEGLQLTIPANAINNSGIGITGKVIIEAMLIRKKGDIIKVNKPTVSNGRQLISGGEIFVQMKNNGNELSLAPGKKISIRYSDVNVSTAMRVFYGDESNLERFNWIQGQDSLVAITQPNPVYELQASKLRWINSAFFADTTGQRISIHASLPVNFTNANTSVYLVYKESRSVLGVYGNATSKKFMTGSLPIGKQVTLVAISKQGPNSYYLAHQNFVTGLNAPSTLTQVVLLSPVPTSMADIRAYLDTL